VSRKSKRRPPSRRGRAAAQKKKKKKMMMMILMILDLAYLLLLKLVLKLLPFLNLKKHKQKLANCLVPHLQEE